MLIQADNSAFSPDRQQSELFEWIPQMQILKMPGSHHLHLEAQAEDVAVKAQAFLNQRDFQISEAYARLLKTTSLKKGAVPISSILYICHRESMRTGLFNNGIGRGCAQHILIRYIFSS